MLEIISAEGQPSAGDWCFAFSGYDAVGDLTAAPGTPWRRQDLEAAFPEAPAGTYIGRWAGQPAFAVDLSGTSLDPLRHVAGSLYTLIGRIDDALFSAHGRALQLLRWQREHRFCGACGGATSSGDRGAALVCDSCGKARYPQLSPCAIVLVTRGDELLLAQAAGRGPGFYSTLAGFVEPGESVEQAVFREVREEVGVEVHKLRYFGSQPWPFPGQLMLGFFAEYRSGEITPDPTEIADAQWFRGDALPPVPPAASISGQLISSFLQQV